MDLSAATIQEIQALAVRASQQETTVNLTLPYNGSKTDYTFAVSPTHNGPALGNAIEGYRPATLKVETLTGLLDAVAAGVAGDTKSNRLVHVEDYLTVSVCTTETDKFGERDRLIVAKHVPIDAFKFDVFYDDPQRFIIALQVAFLPTDELLYLIKLVSNLKGGNSIETNDNGLNQTLTVRRGEVGSIDVPIQPRIKLIPLRSFSEINESSPVVSEFLVRFRQGKAEQPEIALFSIDGTRYKGEIMRSIKHYLGKHLKDVPILA